MYEKKKDSSFGCGPRFEIDVLNCDNWNLNKSYDKKSEKETKM